MKIDRIQIIVLSIITVVLQMKMIHADDLTAYLFAYFTGNDNTKAQESIYFAISDDAHIFKALNEKKPVLSSAKISRTGGVRDPHILRGEDGNFYMVATDMVSSQGWASNRGIVMLRSENLIDWKSNTVNIPESFSIHKAADRVWAPQTIFDPAVGKYMVYFAMRLGPDDRDKIYYAYADTSFSRLESAPELLFRYGDNSAIDADIIFKDSTYHLFFKTEQSGNGIKSALSRKLREGYVLLDKYLQVTGSAVEGSCVFKLVDSDDYVLMYDVYTSGRYEFAVSTDLKTFTKDPKPISFDFTPRHGTVIPITETEKNRLRAKWAPTKIVSNFKGPRNPVSYSFVNNTLELKFESGNGNSIITVLDLSGKVIQRRAPSGKTVRINLASMPAGMYHISCGANNDRIILTRVIVN